MYENIISMNVNELIILSAQDPYDSGLFAWLPRNSKFFMRVKAENVSQITATFLLLLSIEVTMNLWCSSFNTVTIQHNITGFKFNIFSYEDINFKFFFIFYQMSPLWDRFFRHTLFIRPLLIIFFNLLFLIVFRSPVKMRPWCL